MINVSGSNNFTFYFISLHIVCLQKKNRKLERATTGCCQSSQIHSVLRRTAEVVSGVEHDDVAASGAD